MKLGARSVHKPAIATRRLVIGAGLRAAAHARAAMMIPTMISSVMTAREAVDKANPATIIQRPRMKLIQLNAFMMNLLNPDDLGASRLPEAERRRSRGG